MIQQRSKEWFNARKKRVTGSVVGAILGQAPYMKRNDVMRSMVRDALGAEREFKGNIATQWGVDNEDKAIDDFKFSTGLHVDEAPFVPCDDWLGASPDGFIHVKDAVLEVKCPFGLRNQPSPEFKTALEQPHYYAQMQIEMYCTGKRTCYFYQWTPYADKLEIIDYNSKWFEENMPKIQKFYFEFLSELKNPDKHLQPLKDVKRSDFADIYRDALANYETAKQLLDDAKQALIAEADGKSCVLSGLNVSKVEKKGSISYAKALKDIAPKADLEPYRGKPTTYWKISECSN